MKAWDEEKNEKVNGESPLSVEDQFLLGPVAYWQQGQKYTEIKKVATSVARE